MIARRLGLCTPIAWSVSMLKQELPQNVSNRRRDELPSSLIIHELFLMFRHKICESDVVTLAHLMGRKCGSLRCHNISNILVESSGRN